MFWFRGLVLAVSVTLCAISYQPAIAQIYRYQDKDGNWHFTDRDPSKTGESVGSQVEVMGSEQPAIEEDESQSFDLANKLREAYPPKSPIETATLAVVAVESGVAKGSGFFVSSRGHIVTNKHVVRPAFSTNWGEAEQLIAAQREKLESMRRELRTMRRWLDDAEARMSRYQETIEDSIGKERRSAESNYASLRREYVDRKSVYENYKAETQRVKKSYDAAVSEHSRISYASKFTNEFTIILKDDSRQTARLLKLSDNYDLALLKMDGFKTPYISPEITDTPAQGSRVFAIGSPLGMRDFVTSGIITSIKKDAYFTDTQVLPGNSGGPLLNESGQLLGVNTAVVHAGAVGTELFGAALSGHLVKDEFGQLIGAAKPPE